MATISATLQFKFDHKAGKNTVISETTERLDNECLEVQEITFAPDREGLKMNVRIAVEDVDEIYDEGDAELFLFRTITPNACLFYFLHQILIHDRSRYDRRPATP